MDTQPTRQSPSRLRRVAGGVATTAALGAGILGVSSTGPLGIAGAQEAEESPADQGQQRRGAGPLASALEELVGEGVLDQVQADAVTERVRDKAADGHARDRAPGRRLLANAGQVAADTIGITTADLRTAVMGGQSIGQVAEANGVGAATVVDAIVTDTIAKIDEKVAAGEVEAERAEQARRRIPEAAQKIVDRVPAR